MKSVYFLPIIFFTLFFACKTDTKNIDDTIHIRIKKDPERINPLVFPNPLAREVYQYLHLPLADYHPENLELNPILIKGIPEEIKIDTGAYAGGIKYSMEILDQAKWDDGSPITGWDYLFTIKAIKLPLSNAARYREHVQHISEVIVNATDPKKFDVVFSEDYLLALEAAVTVEIYPKYFYDPQGALDKVSLAALKVDAEDANMFSEDSLLVRFAEQFNGNDFSRSQISGSGPYKFVSWESEQHIVLEKKSDYWGRKYNVTNLMNGPDKIVFHIIPDEITAIAQLKSGSIDLMNELSADAFESLRNDSLSSSKLNFFTPALMKYYVINLNNQDPKLSDKRVRKAIAQLVDVDNIISNIEGGLGVRTVGPIYPSKKTYNKQLKVLPYSTETASSLLKEAGWSDSNNNGIVDKVIDGKSLELVLDIYISGQELGKQIALMLQESGQKSGIKFNIIEKDFKLIRAENLKKRNYHLVPTVISQDMNTWDDLSGRWHSKNDTPEGANDMSYRSSDADRILDEILITKNEKDRILLYNQLQEVIYQDQPAIFLYAPFEKIAINKKWKASATPKRPGYMANTFKMMVDGVLVEN